MRRTTRQLLLLLLAALPQVLAAQVGDIKPGDALPRFAVALRDGRTLTDDSLRGRPALIAFFNTACRDCRRELPLLQDLYSQNGTDILYICISREEATGSVQAFWEKEGLTLPYSAQENRSVYNLFARRGIPRIYLTDGTGVVTEVFSEKMSRRKLKAAVGKLLERKRPDQAATNRK